MARQIWTNGAGDNQFDTAGNWTGASEPGTGDVAVFDGTSTASVTGGLGSTGGASQKYCDIEVHPEYTGDIGTSSVRLVMGYGTNMSFRGSGTIYARQDGTSGVFATDAQTWFVDSPNTSLAADFQDNSADLSANMSLIVLRGHVQCDMKINGILITDTYGSEPAPTLVFDTNGAIGTEISLNAGSISCSIVMGAVADTDMFNVGSATLTMTSSSQLKAASGITINGGIVKVNSSAGITGTVHIKSGTLDMREDARSKTVDKVIIYPNGNYYTHAGITTTTTIDLRETWPTFP